MNIQEFSIRSATEDEHEVLTALAHRPKARWGYPSKWMAQWKEQLTISAEYIAQHRVEVAVNTAMQIIGMCSLEHHDDHFRLEHVWIDPAAQGRGIGSILVTRALLAASKLSMPVHLVADQYAQSFYEGLGARVIGGEPAPMPGAPERSLPIMQFDPVTHHTP